MKKAKINILLIASIVSTSLIGLSCKKIARTYTSLGQVLNKSTGEPLAGVEVYLYDGMYGSDPLFGEGSGPDKVDVDTTDSNGMYRVSLKTSSGWVAVTASKKGYHFDDENTAAALGYIKVKRGTNYKELKMEGISFFNPLYVKNSYSQSENDSSRASVLSYNNLSEYFLYGALHQGEGPFFILYEDAPIRAIGDRYLRYKLEWTNDGVWQSKVDSVYLPTSLEVYRDTIYY